MSLRKAIFQSAGRISQHIIPGVFSRVNSIKGAQGFVAANNHVIIGQGYGLKPNTLYQFNSSPEATDVVYGGPLREAIRLAFNPSPDFSPQTIYAMVVNAATQSTYSLDDGANDMIKLDAISYGLHTNQIKLKLEAGSVSGKKLTLDFKGDEEVYDNVEQEMMTIEYTTGVCTLTITNDATVKTLVTSAGGLSLDLGDYANIEEMVAYINDQTGFVASAAAGAESISPTELDEVTALDINGAEKTINADMWAIIKTVNTLSGLVTASDVSAANGVTVPALVATFTYFGTGVNGAYTTTEWTAALVALEAENVQLVSTPDPLAATHASIKAHCESMSNVSNRKERQFLVGGDWGDAVSLAKTNAIALNSKRGLYVHNGFVQRDEAGTLTNFSASYAACLLGAIKSAAAINVPLTSKILNVVALENSISTSNVESLLENGVCALNYDDQGLPAVVRQFNTYQTYDLKFNEFSMMTEMDFVSRDLRNYLHELFIGNPGIKTVLGSVEGAVKNRLQSYVDLGVFTEDSEGRTFWDIIVRLSGDQVIVDYNANITAPINFIFVTQHFSEAA